MGIFIDIHTRLLKQNDSVYVLRPGRNYSLFDEMIAANSVAIELPGLELDANKSIFEQQDLEEKIARSRALQNWYLQQGAPADRPTDILSEYRGRAQQNSISQLRGILQGFYNKIKKSDLVVVPPRHFTEDALIGEFVDASNSFGQLAVARRYGGDLLPARKVKWLGRLPKNKLPPTILETLSKPSVLFQVEQSLKPLFYERAYKIFSLENEMFTAKFEALAQDFTSQDDFLLQAFFNFVAFNTMKIDAGESNLSSLHEGAFADSGAYNPNLRTNINSPGAFSILSNKITPIVAAALLSICMNVDPNDAHEAAKRNKIKLGNSEGLPDDDCVIEIERHVLDQMKLLNLDQWAEACRAARKAVERSKLTNPVETKRLP